MSSIVYQNHDELLKTAAEVLALRERVASEWFGLNVDIGSLRMAPTRTRRSRALAPLRLHRGRSRSRSTGARSEEKTDLRRRAAILRDSGYRGYAADRDARARATRARRCARFLDEVREAMASIA